MSLEICRIFTQPPRQASEAILLEAIHGGSDAVVAKVGQSVEDSDESSSLLLEAHVLVAAVTYINSASSVTRELAGDIDTDDSPSRDEILNAYRKTVEPWQELNSTSSQYAQWLGRASLDIVKATNKRFVSAYLFMQPLWREGKLDALLYATEIDRELPFVIRDAALQNPKGSTDLTPTIRMETPVAVGAAALLLPTIPYMKSMLKEYVNPPTQQSSPPKRRRLGLPRRARG